MSARNELRRYVNLLADSWTPRETTDERVEKLYAKVRAEVLREAADALEARVADVDVDTKRTWAGMDAAYLRHLADEAVR